MKYVRQFAVIMLITCIGEILKYLIPLPVKLEDVKDVGLFLVEIMPLMFIPAAVGLLESWTTLADILLPVLSITVAVTFLVMIVAGKVTDYAMKKEGGKDHELG